MFVFKYNMFIGFQTCKELIQKDASKMITYEIFTMNDVCFKNSQM